MNSSRQSLFFALTLGLLYLATIHLQPYPLSFALKALPILLLGLYAMQNLSGKLQKQTLMAIVLSATGDVLLALTFENQFVFGLGAFLVAQLCYLWIFLSFKNQQHKSLKLLGTAVILGFSGFMALTILPEDLGLKIAIICYLIVIASMAIAALYAVSASWLHFFGAAIFVVSDSLIAWNMFKSPVPFASHAIMLTYYLAQLMIIKGIINLEKQHA